jgi:hypothetical protein
LAALRVEQRDSHWVEQWEVLTAVQKGALRVDYLEPQ